MYRGLCLALLLFACNLPILAWGAETGATTWHAGAARTRITPDRMIWMSGYGNRNQPAQATLTDLWAKALVLQDPNGHQALVITLDLVGIDRDLSVIICKQIEDKLGLERNQIAICCSHTHTGPALPNNLRVLHYLQVDKSHQQLLDAYATELVQRVVSTAQAAVATLEPSQLSWGSGRATFAVNRRENSESGVPAQRLQGGLKGPLDHDVPVLAVRNTTGTLKSVLFGYACHATVLSFYKWSGDYPGFAQIELEQNHPGCVALFWAGCGADQNPLPRRTVALARHYGRRLADAVDTVLLTSQMHPITGKLETSYREIDLALAQLPSQETLKTEAMSSNRFVATRARMLLAKQEQGQPLPTSYPYPIGVWKLGNDVQFIALGGEVVVDFAVRLKAELSGVRTWVAGYTNDVMAYIPSRRVLREGGYEGASAMVYYGLPGVWSEEVEKRIVDEVQHQLAP